MFLFLRKVHYRLFLFIFLTLLFIIIDWCIEGIMDVPDDVLEFIILHLLPYGDMQVCHLLQLVVSRTILLYGNVVFFLQKCRLVCRKWYVIANWALNRLSSLLNRCDQFDWYQLLPSDCSTISNIGARYVQLYRQLTNVLACSESFRIFKFLIFSWN